MGGREGYDGDWRFTALKYFLSEKLKMFLMCFISQQCVRPAGRVRPQPDLLPHLPEAGHHEALRLRVLLEETRGELHQSAPVLQGARIQAGGELATVLVPHLIDTVGL